MIIVVLSFIFFYTFNSENSVEKPPSLDYQSRLKQERVGKDKFFKENEESPIENKKEFKGLTYFEVSEKFKIEAELILDKSGNKNIIQTTDNKADTLVKYGYAKFKLNNQTNQLTIYKTENSRLLFLPFRDKTSGNLTYGGGRFLDIPITDIAGNKVVLDFNLAYHPYCTYNHTYICPIPPKENTLTIEILAGEKL
ncbi:MAG: DUF1684 domain-containing protein [Bacteroidota bacterium]